MSSFPDLVGAGIPDSLPEMPPWDPDVNHAPARPLLLTDAQKERAIAVYEKGIDVAERGKDIQAIKEMNVFLNRLKKQAGGDSKA